MRRGLVAALPPALLAAVLAATAAPSTLAGAADDTDARPVLEPVRSDTGPEQDPGQVAARLAPLTGDTKKLGKSAATVVIDAESGRTLYDDEGSTALIPASTNKIPTSAAVLASTDPDRRLTTRVTLSGSEITLVGGGDPLLTSRRTVREPGYPTYPQPTSLRHLAAQTAARLRGMSLDRVRVTVDDSFFDGPAWNPSWPEYYRTEGIVAPVSALIVDDGREGGGEWAPISTDPALSAGRVFADLLKKKGIGTKGAITRGRPAENAEELAAVESAPIYELVQQTLTTSDNQTAENLFRLAGRFAGFGGSFDGGSRAVQKALESLGVSTVLCSFVDGSGLSRDNALTANLLTDVLRRSVRSQDGLWPIASGLAVAGVNGTLRNRFVSTETNSAAGWLRGKTGTLNYVSSLAGFVQSRSGRLLVFASLANEAKSSYEAGLHIDRIAAAAADCGCPGDSR